MTIDPLRRLSGSVSTCCAALFAVAIAAGCSENQGPGMASGTGGDVASVPPSSLCGATSLSTGAGGAMAVGPTTAPGDIFSPFQPQYGSTVAAAVPPPAISGGTLRVLADGHTAVAADPDRDQVYIVDLASKSVRWTVGLNFGDEPGRVVADISTLHA